MAGITGVNPFSRTAMIEQVRNTNTGAGPSAVSADDLTYTTGTEDALTESMGSGLTYKAAKGKHTSSSNAVVSDAQLENGKRMTRNGQAMLDEGSDKPNEQTSNTGDFQGKMEDNIGSINDNTSLIDSKTNQMLNSGKILQANTQKQQQIAGWIENTRPAIDELNAQAEELEQEALETIPEELGIQAETLDEAMAQISEMIDADQLKELEAQRTREMEIEARLEELDPDNPDDQTEIEMLSGEQEQLLTVLQEPENANMLAASDALSVIADYVDAIGEIQEAIANYQVQIDAKSSESESVENSSQAETKSVNKNNEVVQRTNKQIEDTEDETKDEEDKFKEGYDLTMDIGKGEDLAGTACKLVALPMMAYPPTAAPGNVLNYVGIGLGILGGTTQTVANVAAGVHYGEAAYFLQAGVSAVQTVAGAVSGFQAGAQMGAIAAAKDELARQGLESLGKEAGKTLTKELYKEGIKQAASEGLKTAAGQTTQEIGKTLAKEMVQKTMEFSAESGTFAQTLIQRKQAKDGTAA